MGLSTFIKQLYLQTLGGTAPSGSASSSGDISQMIKYLIANPPSSAMKVTGSGYLVMPAAAAGIDPSNAGSAWANGAWSQVVASTSEADSIIGLVCTGSQNSIATMEADIAIGTGGAGSEIEVSHLPLVETWPTSGIGMAAFIGMFPAVIEVANGTRVAVRVRSSSTSVQPNNIRLIYVKKTELVSR